MALRLHSFQRTSQASLPVLVLVLALLSRSVCNGQSQSRSPYAQYTSPNQLFTYFVVDFKTINITTSEPIADLLSRYPNATGLIVDLDNVRLDQPTSNALYYCGPLTTQQTSCSLTLPVNPASRNDLFIRYRAMKRSTLFGFSSVDTLQITKGLILTPPLVTNVTANESTATVRYLLQQKEAAMFDLMQKSNVTVVIEVGCVEPEELCMSSGSGSGSGSNSGGRTRRYVASLDLNSTVYECDGLEQNRLWRGEIWLEMADSGYNSSRCQFEFRTSEGAESHLFVILIAAFIGFLVLTVASVAVWYAAKRGQIIGNSMRSANNRSETKRLDPSSRVENQTLAFTGLGTVGIVSC